MVDTSVTIFGNLTKDPDLYSTNSVFRCNFRVASTERRWDRSTGQFIDGATVFISVTCWRVLAENVAGSLKKGDPVVVLGRLTQRSYENKEGVTVNLTEIDADVVAMDLRRGTTSRLRKLARQATCEHGFDATRPEGADVGEHGMPGIDGGDTVSEAALRALQESELVGAAAETPF